MLERLITLLALCGFCAAAQAVTVRDDLQQPVEIRQPPQRIVSLLPSLTETVCALGACERLVGVDRYSNWPDRVKALPRMGGGLDPNIELIVAQKPDLVLLAGSTRGVERLQALGITVLRLEPRTHADVQRVLRTVAQALGLPGKTGGMTGADVWPLYREGKLVEIGEYCTQDVQATASIYQRIAPYYTAGHGYLGEAF